MAAKVRNTFTGTPVACDSANKSTPFAGCEETEDGTRDFVRLTGTGKAYDLARNATRPACYGRITTLSVSVLFNLASRQHTAMTAHNFTRRTLKFSTSRPNSRRSSHS
jgi:hypothetical protein